MKEKILPYTTHIICCFTFLMLPYIFTHGEAMLLPDLKHSPHDRTEFIVYLLMLASFYFNYYVLIPKLYFTKKYIYYFILLILFLVFLLYIPAFASKPGHSISFNNPPPGIMSDDPGRPPPPLETGRDVLLYMVGIFVSLFMRINNRLVRTEQDKLKAQLSYLKAQINPHFLFNTLNSIYAMAIEKDDKTADAIVQLSELMRYIIKDAHSDHVSLEKEIGYISNYITLQRSRLGNTAVIQYETTGSATGKQIAPLVLVSFIENAFKHGINPDEDSEIRISITVTDMDIHLLVFNKKVTMVKNKNEEGIGLQNTKERLQLLYPSKHRLVVTDNKNDYSVDLLITLQ